MPCLSLLGPKVKSIIYQGMSGKRRNHCSPHPKVWKTNSCSEYRMQHKCYHCFMLCCCVTCSLPPTCPCNMCSVAFNLSVFLGHALLVARFGQAAVQRQTPCRAAGKGGWRCGDERSIPHMACHSQVKCRHRRRCNGRSLRSGDASR